jgi:hypothetical protein
MIEFWRVKIGGYPILLEHGVKIFGNHLIFSFQFCHFAPQLKNNQIQFLLPLLLLAAQPL